MKTKMTEEECKAKKKAYDAKYKKENKHKVNAYAVERRCKNIEREKEKEKAYRERNKEKLKAYHKEWREKNPDRMKAIAERRREGHREDIRKTANKWRRLHPEIAVLNTHNHRARKKSNGGKLSRGLATRLLFFQKNRCAICRIKLGKKYHIDHIIPIVLGGKNEDKNIQVTCPTCNMQKNGKDPIIFMRSRGCLL